MVTHSENSPAIRIGHGFDVHRLDRLAPSGEGRPLLIGGVAFQAEVGPVAHSDGDALLHAVTDALLGALALPDLGAMFPDNDPRWRGADSGQFVAAAMQEIRRHGYGVVNLDSTIILESPRLSHRRKEIRENLAHLLNVSVDSVNVKGKSNEGVDAAGEGRAIIAHATVLLSRDPEYSQ